MKLVIAQNIDQQAQNKDQYLVVTGDSQTRSGKSSIVYGNCFMQVKRNNVKKVLGNKRSRSEFFEILLFSCLNKIGL